MTAPVRCPEKAPFSLTVILPDGAPRTIWGCRHHLVGMIARETCAIKGASGGRPAVVLPVKPVRRCEHYEEAAS